MKNSLLQFINVLDMLIQIGIREIDRIGFSGKRRFSLTAFKTPLFIVFLLVSISVAGTVKVYPNPDSENKHSLSSNQYELEINQYGKGYKSIVYTSKNPFEEQLKNMTDFNHWSTFEFTGEVEVCLRVLKGSFTGCDIFPKSKNVVPVIKGNEILFKIKDPSKLYVQIAGMEEHPFFLFADAPETYVPSKTDKNTIWFDAGSVYDIGAKYKVKSGQTVYVEGGAWVYGTFALDVDAKDVNILGRGVISSQKLGKKSNAENIPFSTIYAPGTVGNCTIEGVTITDPAHFCIITYIKNNTSNVKLFGWWYQTDGWGGGDFSTLENSFMKVNDDNVKVYHRKQSVKNLVLYQQINGAPFQLSWGNHGGAESVVDGVELVACNVSVDSKPGNADLVNLRHHGKGMVIRDLAFRNITADQGVYRIIGLNNDMGGVIRDVRLENIRLSKAPFEPGFIYLSGGGSVGNIQITNLQVKGKEYSLGDFELKGVKDGVLILN